MGIQARPETNLKWDKFFLEVAKLYASMSKDPSTQVGAVAVNCDRIEVSHGFNGFPRRILDLPDRLANRETKYQYIVHAEVNLVGNAARTGRCLKGTAVYVYGLPPCPECTKLLIQCGVAIVCVDSTSVSGREDWQKRWDFSYELLMEAGIEVWMVTL